tara:strand:- start:283 stop:981 length:699 start_codon:yes stop_codon:yes gene_type:complete
MNIHCCSFASESFTQRQNIQNKFFLKVGFKEENIHLCNPETLDFKFFQSFPNASEKNRFGWFSFKPYFMLSILKKLNEGDILFYLDVNDEPHNGIRDYIEGFFLKNRNVDFLGLLTNYPNLKFSSKFHKYNLSIELLIASLFNCQPEAGAIAIRNSPKARSMLSIWYNLTLINGHHLINLKDTNSRHDQETLFILSRIYKSIKLESWFFYKITGKGLRKYIKFEGLRNHSLY